MQGLALIVRFLFLAIVLAIPGFPQPLLPSGFTDSLVANVSSPTAFAFLPDGRVLVTTQPGFVRIVDGSTLLASPALNLVDRTCSNSERGLLSVAVDPDFESNKHVYLYYTFKNTGSCATGSTAGPWNRVSRFTFSSDSTIDSASELVLVDQIWSFGGNHNGGDLQVGNDGLLYISVGDGGNDYGGSGSAGANDAARERHHLLGKVLRITLGGAIPPGNPYTGPNTARCNAGPINPGQICQEVFAWGLRNPFRLAFDPNSASTRFFINDVGQGAWEEIDVAQAGADYGWNIREGFCANGSTSACPPSNPTPAGLTEPIFAYRHGVTVPGTQTGGCRSITGGAFVPAGIWPVEFDNAYLFSDYVCGAIFSLKQNGSTVNVSDFVRNLGNSSAVHLRFGPYGDSQALYYTTYAGGGQLRRVAYASSVNSPPTANISASPTSGDTPLLVSFSAEGSGDPNPGDILTFFWNFGDSTPEQSTSSLTISHTYSVQGTYIATLRVRDSQGAFSPTVSIQITAGNQAPQLSMVSPATGFTFAVGDTVSLVATAIDPEEGALPPGSLTWRVILHHDDHVHPFLGPLVGNNLQFQAPAPEDLFAASNSYLEVVLSATDASGATAELTRDIQPRKVLLTFETDPTGLDLLVNNETISGGTSVTSWQNFLLSVSVPAQSRNGVNFDFDSWADGAPRNRAITTPAAAALYTARFRDVSAGGGFTTVGAGSFQAGPVARGSIATGFGENLAQTDEAASTLPLPTQIQGISMRIVDSGGTTRALPLFFVSSLQINFLVPDLTSLGNARVEVLRNGVVIAFQSVQIVDTAPSVFTANQDGMGVPAAEIVQVDASGNQTVVPVFSCSGDPELCVPAPVRVASGTESSFLVLYVTGLRNRPVSPQVRVLIGGVEAELSFAGPQPQFLGLDQVNVKIPPELGGRGLVTVSLVVGEIAANAVEILLE